MKKILVKFEFQNVSESQYLQVWDELKAAGHSHPKGLLYHVGAAKPNGGWCVMDVWESEQAFQTFANILMPLIGKTGIPMVPPEIMPVSLIVTPEMNAALA